MITPPDENCGIYARTVLRSHLYRADWQEDPDPVRHLPRASGREQWRQYFHWPRGGPPSIENPGEFPYASRAVDEPDRAAGRLQNLEADFSEA